MARLRIRIELNGGGGVPLHKLTSVVHEAQNFLNMLAEDVHIEPARGEWLGFDFDHQSLSFTAEFIGAVTPAQIQAFYAAFDGTTALRRATVSQFARITDAIGEDELIGFGRYQSERDSEPTEWRSLSRRDARRIAEEIQVLAGATGDQNSHLPVSDTGASMFGPERDGDLGLAARLARVERKVDEHSTYIRDLRSQSVATEENFRNLLTGMEGFCDQAASQIQKISSAAPPGHDHRSWILAGAGGLLAAVILVASTHLWPERSAEPLIPKTNVTRTAPEPAREPIAAPTPEPTPVPRPQPMRIEMDASEPTWVAMTDSAGNHLYSGLLSPGVPRTIEVDHDAKLRTGNAGGLLVKLNGQPLGAIGPHGKVREIEFKDNAYSILTPE
jgi:Domain of unknown function (DUF4115)